MHQSGWKSSFSLDSSSVQLCQKPYMDLLVGEWLSTKAHEATNQDAESPSASGLGCSTLGGGADAC